MDYLILRLKEATTWQAIMAAVAGVSHVSIDGELGGYITTAGVALFCIIGFFKKDAKSPDAKVSPSAVANGRSLPK